MSVMETDPMNLTIPEVEEFTSMDEASIISNSSYFFEKKSIHVVDRKRN